MTGRCMLMDIYFTLCFIRHQEKFLMLFRNKSPNQHKWNGVGGKIERGESPTEAILREIKEESGLNLASVVFKGIVTWNNTGGMYVFVADSPTEAVVSSPEGRLEWKSLDWIEQSDDVVVNIPIFFPPMLREEYKLSHYAFTFDQEGKHIIEYDVQPIQALNSDGIIKIKANSQMLHI